jgi:His-Xaa-Ser system radical SAM maturase HxsC
MLALHTHGTLYREHGPSIVKVLGLREALSGSFPADRVFIDTRGDEPIDLSALGDLGFAGAVTREKATAALPQLHSLSDDAVVASGDVLRLHRTGQVNVLYRRGANANALFATERCNSYCLMCSQPPRAEDDSWRVAEMHDIISLIDPDIPVLGMTGGEPGLLGAQLAEILAHAAEALPAAHFHVLTNGRLFADAAFTALFRGLSGRILWAVPLYGDTAALHDHVVQATGAFDETINGIYNLAESGHRIELRCVVQKQTLPRLTALSSYIYRNLPFADHIAFMGLEPMGFARKNRDALWIDPVDYQDALEAAVYYLADRQLTVSVYNLPLCVLPPGLRPFARQSISDWKNVFVAECAPCVLKGECSGFFRSAGLDWRSRAIAPILEETGT